ncbi:hypothetical protein QQS21_001961 [Conoideocrella luteorostrata]|uniref:Major facilitator superfamily (MFS) profile domain-containing protein n=1 Tax=Conoideocrella luteorostrata TaxID=1105319 RepID=A0AAJ0CW50_9HYPO|nr:hypothetical protein QQS21_001961 [Conoideocrella luteorostrata]
MSSFKIETAKPSEDDNSNLENLKSSDYDAELERALESYVPDSDAEKRLVRKIDITTMPLLWFMYLLACIDRQNIGNAKIAGMDVDLSLSDDQYAMLLTVFSIAYFIFEVPSNLLLTRTKPSFYLAGIMIAWGIVCVAMGVIRNYPSMLGLRLSLGAIEAGFFPGALFLMTCWYKKSEVGKRFSIFYSASVVSGAMGGLLAGIITGNMEGSRGIRGWRWLYILQGSITIAVAIVAKFLLLDFPEQSSRFMKLEERQLVILRMVHDRNTIAKRHKTHLTPAQAFKAAIIDPRTYIFIVLFVLNSGSMTITYFIPTIVQSMGYNSVVAQYMTIPVWMVGIVFLVGLSYTADRTADRRWHISGCLGLSFICTVVCIAVSSDRVLYAMVSLYIAGLHTALPLILNWASEVISLPSEKRAVALALVNSIGNLSPVYGSRLWPSSDGPRYTKGFVTTGVLTGFGMLLAALIPVLLKYLGKKGRTEAERGVADQEPGHNRG